VDPVTSDIDQLEQTIRDGYLAASYDGLTGDEQRRVQEGYEALRTLAAHARRVAELEAALREARDWIADDDPGDADTGGFHATLVNRLDAALAGDGGGRMTPAENQQTVEAALRQLTENQQTVKAALLFANRLDVRERDRT
jgi:hypothetical protein